MTDQEAKAIGIGTVCPQVVARLIVWNYVDRQHNEGNPLYKLPLNVWSCSKVMADLREFLKPYGLDQRLTKVVIHGSHLIIHIGGSYFSIVLGRE